MTSRLRSISVGHANADILGHTGHAIQIAIDALALRGGGQVTLGPGEFVLHDSLRLHPHIRLVGQGDKTILRREKLVWSDLALDADIGQNEITLANAGQWREGMAVCLWDNKEGWGIARQPRIVTDVEHNVLRLDDLLTVDRRAEHAGRAVNFFPMILAERADGSALEGLTVDAAVDDPHNVLNAMRITAIYFRRSVGISVKHVTVKNARGDGIIVGCASTGAVIEDCETFNNDNYGIHPGSHSKNCAVRRCRIHHNGSDGLYICWGIKNSEFTDNVIHHNGGILLRSGISIGHKDTDNLIARNHIHDNKKYGIAFREKTPGNAAHRVTLRDNLIENNGSAADELTDVKKQIRPWESIGCGVHVMGMTQDLLLDHNTIRETRAGDDRLQRHALYLRAGVSNVTMHNNQITGHPEAPIVDESHNKNSLEFPTPAPAPALV